MNWRDTNPVLTQAQLTFVISVVLPVWWRSVENTDTTLICEDR
jgi:hypothetical protein